MSGATCIGQWHPSVRMPPRLSAGRSHTGCSAHNGISCSESCDSFRNLLHDFFGADDILAEVHGCSPQTHNLAAETVGDVHRIDIITARLGHGAAVLVERPSVSCDHAVRRTTLSADRTEQGRVKPAAVLISALEINVGWPGQIRLMPEHGDVAGTGFEPDVDDIGLFAEFSSATFAALGSSGKCVGFGRIPGIGAEAAEEINYFAIERRIIQRLAAAFAQEHSNRPTPDALARDAA